MEIKSFTAADIKAAHVLWRSTKGVCNCDKCMELDSEMNLQKYMIRNPSSCFVAVDSGTLVGTILAGHDGRTGFIYRLTVSENCREQGIGKALVAASVKALKAEGVLTVVAFVLNDNPGGLIFWDKIGFCDDGRAVTLTHRIDKGE
jgi:ribosomal protein S18 acetylase RimI-like enzyme